jgi:hypothetical protein
MTFHLCSDIRYLSLQINPAKASSARSTVFPLISSVFPRSLHSLQNTSNNPPHNSSGTMIRINTLSHVMGLCMAVPFSPSLMLPGSSSKTVQYDNLINTLCNKTMMTSPIITPLPESACVPQGEAARRPSASYRSSRHRTSVCITLGIKSIASAMIKTLTASVESRAAILVVCRSRACDSDDERWRCVGSMLGRTSIVRLERGGWVQRWSGSIISARGAFVSSGWL